MYPENAELLSKCIVIGRYKSAVAHASQGAQALPLLGQGCPRLARGYVRQPVASFARRLMRWDETDCATGVQAAGCYKCHMSQAFFQSASAPLSVALIVDAPRHPKPPASDTAATTW